MKTVFQDKVILLTGGTGSFGRAFTRALVRDHAFRALRIFSRDELKQSEMRAEFKDSACASSSATSATRTGSTER